MRSMLVALTVVFAMLALASPCPAPLVVELDFRATEPDANGRVYYFNYTGDPLYQWPPLQLVGPEHPASIEYNRHQMAVGDTVCLINQNSSWQIDQNGYLLPTSFQLSSTTKGVIVERYLKEGRREYGYRVVWANLYVPDLPYGKYASFTLRQPIPEQMAGFYRF